jgi:peptide/nickel transport system ATP-binding protein
MSKLLEVLDLRVDFKTEHGVVHAVRGISFEIQRGAALGIVGESGSGKSATALSLMRLLPQSGVQSAERMHFYSAPQVGPPINGRALPHPDPTPEYLDLQTLSDAALGRYRGAQSAMIFQEPMRSLNPVFRCGPQVEEAVRRHQNRTPTEAKAQTSALFEKVKLDDPTRIYRAYPHQLSGGQKQRVMIAMALANRPALLIADEPTTALDVTVQKSILDLLRELRAETGMALLFISHDLGVVSELCDHVAVMYQGEIVETGPAAQIFEAPQHPYTRGLAAGRPSLRRRLHRLPTVEDFLVGKKPEVRIISNAEAETRREKLYAQTPLLEVRDLSLRYPARKNWLGRPVEWLNAVDRVDFSIFPGETFGIAGESGCGKTTLGRCVARLIQPDKGVVLYKGQDLCGLTEQELRPFRREIQMIFQDPSSALNPRMRIGDAIAEPMKIHGLYNSDTACKDATAALLETVGLKAEHYGRYPHEFSGGQRQRVCIARALALKPRLLICDECVSSLDVSVQATVLNLLLDLREQFGLTYLFISHDLGVIRQMCDRLLVMHAGKTEAIGVPEELYENPKNAYVRRLVEAVPGQGRL